MLEQHVLSRKNVSVNNCGNWMRLKSWYFWGKPLYKLSDIDSITMIWHIGRGERRDTKWEVLFTCATEDAYQSACLSKMHRLTDCDHALSVFMMQDILRFQADERVLQEKLSKVSFQTKYSFSKIIKISKFWSFFCCIYRTIHLNTKRLLTFQIGQKTS